MTVIALIFIVGVFAWGVVASYLALVRQVAQAVRILPTPQQGFSSREWWALRFALLGGSLLVYVIEGPLSGHTFLYFLLAVLMPVATLAIAATERPREFALLGNAGVLLQLLLMNIHGPNFGEYGFAYVLSAFGFVTVSLIAAVPFAKVIEERERLAFSSSPKSL